MYDKFKALQLDKKDGVLTVTMDNPPLNAAGPEIHDDLIDIFKHVAIDDEVKVVVITGAGKAFSAGGDLNQIAENMYDANKYIANMMSPYAHMIAYNLLNLDKVTVAKINGDAMGLGASLALLCDISIATEKARIADPHVAIGLSAGDGGSYLWPLNIGFARAKWHLLTGEPMTAELAEQAGLISKMVPADEFHEFADGVIEKLANGPTFALNQTKRSINMLMKRQLEGVIEAHWGMEVFTLFSKDHRTAIEAYLNKTKPVFEGR